ICPPTGSSSKTINPNSQRRRNTRAYDKERTMAKFMLLLYDNPSGWAKLSPEEMQKAIEKYRAWMQKSVDAQRLAQDVGKVIRAQGGKPRVTDGPYSETKEVLGGYYTIEAADYDEAVQKALTHPHVEYGNTIEIRQVYGTVSGDLLLSNLGTARPAGDKGSSLQLLTSDS